MDVVTYVILGVFVIFAAVMAMKQKKQNDSKSYEQRRDELYEYSQQRVEEFRKTETKENDSSEEG